MPNRKFAVLTDSACDLPPEMAAQSDVDILNFSIAVDGKGYTEREDFTFEEYYEMLRECEGIPVTSHITMPRFLNYFEEQAEKGVEDVLYVPICGSGSSTMDAAVMAKREFEAEHPGVMRIHIVDSHTYSMGYGWYVVEACRKLQNGAEMNDVVEWLEDIFSRVEVYLSPFSLKFVKKSGRVSAAAAFAGELLGLRPVLSLVDGDSKVMRKVRGDKEVLPAIADIMNQKIDENKQYMIGATHPEYCEELAKMLTKRWKVEPLVCFKLGSAVTTNTGPDAVGVVLLGNKRAR